MHSPNSGLEFRSSGSHGCPAALFRDVNVLNTKTEGGR